MRRAGFTLIETIMALSVLAIVGGVAFIGVMRVADLSHATDQSVDVALDGWSAMTRIADDIAHASSIVTPPAGGTSASLTLNRDAGSYDGCASCVDRSLAIGYRIDTTTGQLLRTGDGISSPMIGDVSSFTITATGSTGSTRLYSITLTVTPPGGRPHSLVTAVRPLRSIKGTWRGIVP